MLTMPDNVEFDPTDKGTLRPNDKALTKKGDRFIPMKLPDFDHEIKLPNCASPEDPISLFTLYYTPEIIDWMVDKTNSHERYIKDPNLPFVRGNNWVDTTSAELYIFMAIRIYMTLAGRNEIADY